MTNQYTKFANTNLKFTPAAVAFHQQSPMLLDLAVTISHDEELSRYAALAITINVGEHGGKVIVTNVRTNEVMYCRQYEPSEVAVAYDNYQFYVINDVLMVR